MTSLSSSFSVLNVTEIAVVGGKLESNGILDEDNIDEELKVFYIQSKKVDSSQSKDRIRKGFFPFSCIFIMNEIRLSLERNYVSGQPNNGRPLSI